MKSVETGKRMVFKQSALEMVAITHVCVKNLLVFCKEK